MKLTVFQLEAQLSKKLALAYIVSGEELLLKQDANILIRKAAKQAGFSEHIRLTPETGFDWDKLYSLLYANSLFAEKRLLELNFFDVTLPKAASAILQEYAKNPSPSNVLLIDIGKVDVKIAKSAWYSQLEKIGMVVNIWPVPREQLPQWIIQRAKRYKLDIQPDAANLLADYIEGNLGAAAQAIEKIYLLKPSQSIDSDLIHTLLTDESHFTIFDFVENLISGDAARALHILDSLKNEGTEPILIIWGVTRELRLLADFAQQLKEGLTFDNLFQKYRIFARRQSAIRHFLTKTSLEDCWHHLKHAADIDKIIKGAVSGNIWESLQLFCLRLV
jgi:DNA polymerase-3 subunit delta